MDGLYVYRSVCINVLCKISNLFSCVSSVLKWIISYVYQFATLSFASCRKMVMLSDVIIFLYLGPGWITCIFCNNVLCKMSRDGWLTRCKFILLFIYLCFRINLFYIVWREELSLCFNSSRRPTPLQTGRDSNLRQPAWQSRALPLYHLFVYPFPEWIICILICIKALCKM